MRIQCRYFPILEISPKKCVAHLQLYLLGSRMNAKDFLRSVGKCFMTSQLLLLENCLLHSSIKSTNIYSAAATSARNAFHYSCCLTPYSDIFKAEYCSSTVQQSLVFKILNADLQLLQADFAISHSYNTNADYSLDSDCSAAQFRN